MPKVTSVEPQKKNPKRFNIFLDGSFAFGADEDLVVNYRLVVGKVISENDIPTLLLETEVGKLLERMYRLFSIRQRSEREVRNYLKELSFKRKLKGDEELSEYVINSLIERLKEKGLVSDKEFAKAWVESRRKNKNKGKIAIKMELAQKGISREIIEEVLGEENVEDSEDVLALKAIEKKLKSWRNLDDNSFKKKAYDFLMRKGFEYQTVASVVAKVLKKA